MAQTILYREFGVLRTQLANTAAAQTPAHIINTIIPLPDKLIWSPFI